jgi:hypothetical protein
VRRRRRRGVGPTLRRWRTAVWIKPVKLALAGLVGVGLLAAIWGGWTAYRVYSDLSEAKDQALIVEASLSRGDIAGAQQANVEFQDLTDSAAGRTDGAIWSVFEGVPIFGDDAAGLATVSGVLSDLADDGIPPILESAALLNAGAFTPVDNQFPLDRIAALEEPASESSAAFADAAARLRAIDSDGFTSPLRTQLDVLRDEVDVTSATLETAVRATQLMPHLLGGAGPRDYLLVFQNNAEVRATGGLPGVMSLIHAENGRVDITRQASAGAMGMLDRPVLPLTPDEKQLFGSQLGTYFLDSNFTPDFPRASELWRARWQVETDSDIDGVFVVDPVAVSYLLGTTGALQVEDQTLTALTIVTEVEHLAYLRYDNQFDQDDFFNAVAQSAFDVFAGGGGNPVDLVEGLIRGVNEHRILMHSFDAEEQTVIEGTTIAGELPEVSTSSPQVGVYLNDGTGAKMSFFLDHEVQVTSASCEDGRQRLTARLRVTSDTPPNVRQLPEMVTGFTDGFADSVRPGDQIVVADLYAPIGGTIRELAFDGDPLVEPAIDHHLGRDVLSIGLPLEPGQTRVVTWSMVTGADQPGPIDVTVTPGPRAENESTVAPSTC